MTCLAKDLLPSSWAASADGPKQAMPASRTASAAPATSGTSGPIDDELGAPVDGDAGHVVGVGGVDRERFGDRAGAGVAGRAGERAHRRVGGESHAQGVLPGTGADHQHAHGSRI